MALFLGPSGWASSRRELLDFMVQGKIYRGRHTDHPAGHHSIRINQCPPPPSMASPHIFLRAAQPTVSKHWRQNLSPSPWSIFYNTENIDMEMEFHINVFNVVFCLWPFEWNCNSVCAHQAFFTRITTELLGSRFSTDEMLFRRYSEGTEGNQSTADNQ